ncbi:glycine amidinotransferase [Streptomyces sp. WAC06614]|uniref:glycine amidinotransferase n=1 Tax=Streptomyces sp. WAC06614 TaxID=2487416 RepID=UPI000F795821|nr:glycine amidinotransferase [Streptomyces sp. WAC06614]RSS82229.1 glycine amidinotransferase [Streptomyces sp. WAC06614]
MLLNSYDEWSPLREVIVGSAESYVSHERELSFELFFHDNIAGDNDAARLEWYYPRLRSRNGTPPSAGGTRVPVKRRYVDELNEDLQGLAETLASLGVTVHRPTDVAPETAEVRTPAWSASVVPPLNLRDNTLIAGDEIIETAPMIRSRYFETQLLKPVFQEYFRRGARWSVMPRPLMTDASFDLSYARSSTAGGPMEPIEDPRPSRYDVGHEMLFDAAQCLRLGRDIVANIATRNHALGVDWLERHLEGRFRVHRVHRLSDSHIDSMVLALRPGTLLCRSEAVLDLLPEPLRTWDVIVPPAPQAYHFPRYEDDDLILTSRYIDLNVLSVDPETVLVNEACPELVRELERRGFTVVPVRHRHRRLFGGGFHCFTLDTVRDGGPEDYLG